MTRFDYKNSTDCALLAQFEQVRDQSAFAELVLRHGPMVMATCVRTLGHEPDADDAFQATFLALAKGVQRIRNKNAVAGWLHQTAKRTSSSIKRGFMRHHTEPMNLEIADSAADESLASPMTATANRESLQILDEELGRLPSKLRVIVVLCHLEGLSLSDAARRLGITPGSAHVRLAKARAKLKARLVTRGVTITLAVVTTALLSSTSETAAMVVDRAAMVAYHATAFATGKLGPNSAVTSAVVKAAEKEVANLLLSSVNRSVATVALLLMATCVFGSLGYEMVRKLTATPTRIFTVAPAGLVSTDGNSSEPSRPGNVVRTQERWSASDFQDLPEGGAWLIGFADRLDASVTREAVLSQDVTISVSTCTRESISRSYEENCGADVVQVFSGEVTRRYSVSDGAPNPFGDPFVFDTPFLYDPSKGDLLLDLRVNGATGSDTLYDSHTSASSVGNFGRLNGSLADGFFSDHIVTKFIFSIQMSSTLRRNANEQKP